MVRKKLDPQTRKKRLELDANECQLSQLFGITHLSGVKCLESLEVHHITYRNSGKETVEDLITVCRRCHDFLTNYIRMLRFTHKNKHLESDMEEVEWPAVETGRLRDERVEIQDDKHDPHVDAQWATERSAGRLRPGDWEDFQVEK